MGVKTETCRNGLHGPERARDRDGRCRPCAEAAWQRKYAANKTAHITKAKAWRKRNPDRRRAIQRRWRSKNASRIRGYILKRHGLTLAQGEALLRKQGFACAICLVPFLGAKVCVDHCHASGRVRGLLCDDCNLGLGKFGDDPERLRAAAEYVVAD